MIRIYAIKIADEELTPEYVPCWRQNRCSQE